MSRVFGCVWIRYRLKKMMKRLNVMFVRRLSACCHALSKRCWRILKAQAIAPWFMKAICICWLAAMSCFMTTPKRGCVCFRYHGLLLNAILRVRRLKSLSKKTSISTPYPKQPHKPFAVVRRVKSKKSLSIHSLNGMVIHGVCAKSVMAKSCRNLRERTKPIPVRGFPYACMPWREKTMDVRMLNCSKPI